MAAAADQVLAARDAVAPPSAKVQVLLQYLLTADAGAVAQPRLARGRARAGAAVVPQQPDLLWTMAEQRFRAGEFERAANLLERLVRLGKTGTFDRSQAFAPEIVGEQAVLNLGMCHLKLGRPAEAEACFLQLAPSPAYGALAPPTRRPPPIQRTSAIARQLVR